MNLIFTASYHKTLKFSYGNPYENEVFFNVVFMMKNDLMSIKYGDSNPEVNIFYLKNSLTLDASYLKGLGLKGM